MLTKEFEVRAGRLFRCPDALSRAGYSRLLLALLVCFQFVLAGPPTQAASSVIAWGRNIFGECDVPPDLTNAVAVAAGYYHSLALTADGMVVGWGSDSFGQLSAAPSDLTNVVRIAAGFIHSMALRADGTMAVWGQTAPTPELTNVLDLAGGQFRGIALEGDGAVIPWGESQFPPDLTNMVAIAAGLQHSLALRADGTVEAWGNDFDGQADVPAGLSNVVAIAGGQYHSLALKSDGTVEAWGSHEGTNVPPGLSNVVAIAAGAEHSLALIADGTVVAWGAGTTYTGNDPDWGQSLVASDLTNVVAVSGGQYHSLALVNPATEAPPQLANPVIDPGDGSSSPTFGLSLATVRGKSYRLEFKNSLSAPAWTPLPPVPGDDTTKILTDPSAADSQRFYRVRVL